MTPCIVSSDLLVIGSGIAGLSAALEARKQGLRVRVISKSPPGKASNTYLAGGMFTFATETFSREEHLETSLATGGRLNDRLRLEAFIDRAPDKVRELLAMGLQGSFQQTGFSCRTSGFIGGPSLAGLLLRSCREAEVEFSGQMFVQRLLVSDRSVCGAFALDKQTGQVYGFQAPRVILATGGAGSLYARNDNAPGALGDGYTLGLAAGLECIDMEFVQFYPLVSAESVNSHMILPAVLADWGRIGNPQGEDIRAKYELPETGAAIVARDRLSRAMFTEIAAGRAFDGALHLEIEKADWERVPLDDAAKQKFIEKTRHKPGPIRVTPAAHHTMGGLLTDPRGRTALEGLYAIGEVVGGIHGANRVGGNALCEALVYAESSVRSLLAEPTPTDPKSSFESLVHQAFQEETTGFRSRSADSLDPGTILQLLRESMWEGAGIIRSRGSLEQTCQTIETLQHKSRACAPGTPRERVRLQEIRKALLAARAITLSALQRTESRGAHFREDWPREDPNWQRHVALAMSGDEVLVTRSIEV